MPDGDYLVELGNISSKTWHSIPAQSNCNTCHEVNGNASTERTKLMNDYHTRIPLGNDCTACHHYPASMSYDQLMTPGVLVDNNSALSIDESFVEIKGAQYPIEPGDLDSIQTVRPDIFVPGYCSAFYAILEVADKNGIIIKYVWDDSAKIHWITTVDGDSGHYWYRWANEVFLMLNSITD